MDNFKQHQFNFVGISGFKCHCCNGLTRKRYGKIDKKFNRMARARMKSKLQVELLNY